MSGGNLAVIVLAAGQGTRMRSSMPKVMHRLANEPMIAHALRAAAPLSPRAVMTVIAPGMDSVREAATRATPGCLFAEQAEQKGTGHAVAAGLKCLFEALADFRGDVLVIYGDTPLIQPETLAALMEKKRAGGAAIALLGMRPADPTGYGRLVMRGEADVERIVECKDASAEEKKLPWVWGGVMAFDAEFLREGLAALAPSPATGEYYLTALVEMAHAKGLRTVMSPISVEEAMGVNTRAQLAQAEAALQNRLRARAMEEGATLIAPETVFFSADTQLARDVVVHPNVVFGAKVRVGEGAEIRAFSHIEGAEVGAGAVVGPFARLRPGTRLGERAHVGNFVEVKASVLEAGAKANHLSYIGDAQVGAEANIGAGTITCNYDGFAKHRTEIGARAFIGSNSALVAPVSIGAGAVVGAGSVVTENVPADALAIARGEQRVKPGGAEDFRARKKR